MKSEHKIVWENKNTQPSTSRRGTAEPKADTVISKMKDSLGPRCKSGLWVTSLQCFALGEFINFPLHLQGLFCHKHLA